MAKRVYTDEDKALVIATLSGNDGNVKRTHRETGIPEQTVRDWKKEMERGETKAAVLAALPAAADDFVVDATRIRNLALAELEAQIHMGEVKGAVLVTAIGVLTDKIRLTQGLATAKVEKVETPSLEAQALAIQGYLNATLSASTARAEEIVDAEFEEQAPAALLPAS